MRKILLLAVAITILMATATVPITTITAQTTAVVGKATTIKTRLDHLSGTQWLLVISYLPSEIVSITCENWTMLGINSWHHQNDFTIPAGPSVTIMDTNKFNGYCKDVGSIVAHTDDGDFVGTLDRGPGNWDASTKLTFTNK